MNESWSSIASILGDLGIDARNISVMAIGLPDTEPPDFVAAHVYETVSSPDDLPQALRTQLGIVVTPLDYMPHTNAEQLLSRLRDVHCEKVLLVDEGSGWNPDALRSLGYLGVERSPGSARCYLFDPDMFNQEREWNNPSDWANPHNFRKYRW